MTTDKDLNKMGEQFLYFIFLMFVMSNDRMEFDCCDGGNGF